MLALDIQNVTKTYKGGVHALKGVSFQVEPGDYFALLGPNGAGKTTLISILTSLVVKSSGKISIFGHDTDKDFSAAKACLGVVPQEFNFSIFRTVLEVVIVQAGFYGVPRKIALQRAEKYLTQLGLWEKRNEVSQNLSGGMKRRLMIARALMHEPKMLVLDEPTAGVDVELRHSMWGFLRELNANGVTIILTTHYLEEAETQCRNIAIIDHGEIIENTALSLLLQKLDAESFILYLRDKIVVAPEINGYYCHLQDPYTLEVEVPKNLGISELFNKLHERNIHVDSLRNKTNRLEALFIKLTNTIRK